MKGEPAHARSNGNNFDSLRIMAALAVLFSHTFPLTLGSDEWEPLYKLSGGQATVGTAAVGVFFVISGFLITRSFDRGGLSWHGMFQFVLARALRILPALFVVLIVLAFVIGPVLSSLPASEYFRRSEVFSFVGINVSLLSFRDGLPGVLTHNPFPASINGSLWTLKYEARCYIIILVLGIVQLLDWRVIGFLLLLVLGAIPLKLGNAALFEWTAFFLGGAFLYLQPLPLNTGVVVSSAALIIGSFVLGGYSIVAPLFGSYLVFWLATSPAVRLPRLAKFGDFSYGVYVYAFPVQQIVTLMMGQSATWYWNGIISAPITLLLAVLSWHLVERPALALKRGSSRAGFPLLRAEGQTTLQAR